LFSILAARIEGAVFADLYAGTGAVGIEALSRGAKRAIFVESDRAALAVLRENLRSLGLLDRAEVRGGKASAVEADVVFLDPPYHNEREYTRILASLTAPLVIAQHDVRLKLGVRYGHLQQVRMVRQGDNCLSFYEPDATIENAGA
jgi:16S rRNA (guanine(966)-N(2))-methyltransferase RsmD